ncbi:MAG: hypothetical protein LJE91_07955 [Gammaproteobacteria bacterium]|nr:hypothetical protein [Gammaproteobacteria bacterium]
MKNQILLFGAVTIVALAPILHTRAAELSGYTVRQLELCIEGDSDVRWGAASEGECKQYINGFTDTFLPLAEDPKAAYFCLPPPGNRPDEIRWAFMKWSTDNRDKRDVPAAEGLMATVKEKISCK